MADVMFALFQKRSALNGRKQKARYEANRDEIAAYKKARYEANRDVYAGIGRKIKDVRLRRGCTQRDVASLLGVSAQLVSHLETGRAAPTDRLFLIFPELREELSV